MHVQFMGMDVGDARSEPLLVTSLDLGSLDVRSSDRYRMGSSASIPGRDFFDSNVIRFTLMTNRKNFDDAQSTLAPFYRAWRNEILNSSGSLVTLGYRHSYGDMWRYVLGRPDASTNPAFDESMHHGFGEAGFEFRQLDPLTYSQETSVVPGEFEPGTSGIYVISEEPTLLSFSVDSNQLTQPENFFRIGDATFTIAGPETIDGQYFINPREGTVTHSLLDGDFTSLLSRNFSFSDLLAEPGLLVVEAPSSIRFTYRAAFMSF